jgi:hypothetical protein
LSSTCHTLDPSARNNSRSGEARARFQVSVSVAMGGRVHDGKVRSVDTLIVYMHRS